MDLLGGPGGACPGLLPLRLLVNWRSAILNGVLPHNDGLFMLQLESQHSGWTTFFLKWYFTDSGHYLVATDNFGKPDVGHQEQLKKADEKLIAELMDLDVDTTRISGASKRGPKRLIAEGNNGSQGPMGTCSGSSKSILYSYMTRPPHRIAL